MDASDATRAHMHAIMLMVKQVGTFLHEVKEGAVHAKDEVKGQLKRVRAAWLDWAGWGGCGHESARMQRPTNDRRQPRRRQRQNNRL